MVHNTIKPETGDLYLSTSTHEKDECTVFLPTNAQGLCVNVQVVFTGFA